MRYLILNTVLLLLMLFYFGCKEKSTPDQQKINHPDIYHQSLKALTDVIVHDIFSPPVASRIYLYSTIAGYETVRFIHPESRSLQSFVGHLPVIETPANEVCLPYASTLAMLYTGKALIFSETMIDSQIQKVTDYYKNAGLDRHTIEISRDFGKSVSDRILSWAKKDNYAQTRSYPKYSIQSDPATWKPTPPGYMDAVEPSWNKIRPFVLDSAQQFKPARPTPFNMKDKNSAFYKEVLEVYNAVKNGSEEEKLIANFWDCNPFKLNVTGHVMHATKKISPGGHWMNITGVACRISNQDFFNSARLYVMTSIGLFEGFLSCWDEKYRSLLVRPETVINEYIDPDWLPLLQTPPFPEYTSGHSVISAAAATILTGLLGEDFAFDDDTEVEFGLPVRSFRSFRHAADEASISRLYGGIHYRPAIENGVKQGNAIGKLILERIRI